MQYEKIRQKEKPSIAGTPKSSALLRRVTYASVIVAISLVLVKFVAWTLTDSVSILSGLIDSLLDAIASVINLIAVRQALVPADYDHRFGHGKAEALSGLAQSTFILGSIAFLLFEVIPRLFFPQPIENSMIGVSVSIFAIILTVALVSYQRYVIRRTQSLAISADSLHYLSDILLNFGVIAALVLSSFFGWLVADPVFAVAIAIFILLSAARIFRSSYDQLMDREFPDKERALIEKTVLEHPAVLNIHDLRTRRSGYNSFIQLHLDLPADISLMKAHEISDEVELSLLNLFPESEVIIHQDPEGVEEVRAEFD